MSSPHARTAALPALLFALGGCASGPALVAPEVPAALRVPAGQTVFLEALATGVQIYECAPKADRPSVYEWTFRAPEAVLADRAGRPLGKHYAGPTWEAPDGSTVVGALKARDPGPDPSAIPWLLLASQSSTGHGVFSQTQSIQRVQTAGGLAPAQSCTRSSAGQRVRVPYTASYYFYRAAP